MVHDHNARLARFGKLEGTTNRILLGQDSECFHRTLRSTDRPGIADSADMEDGTLSHRTPSTLMHPGSLTNSTPFMFGM